MTITRTTRVVVHNVSGEVSTNGVARTLTHLAPDVVCLLGLSAPRRLRSMLKGTGLTVSVRGGQRGEGNAVLVRSDLLVRSTDRIPLVSPRGVPDREAVRAIVSVGGLSLAIFSIQFGFRPEVRTANLDMLRSSLASVSPPVVVGAFVNESVNGPVVSALAADHQDAFAVAGSGVGDTYPADDPVARRDFAFVDRRLTISRCFVDDSPRTADASRHRPVVVDLDLDDPSGAHRG